jgi:hypothetical protein
MIDHKAIAMDVLEVLTQKHKLTHDETVKCLIYTTTKLLAFELKCPDVEAAEVLSKAALRFRDMILKVERMTKNKG